VKRKKNGEREQDREKRGELVHANMLNEEELALNGAAFLFAMDDEATLMLSESFDWSFTTSERAPELWELLDTRGLSDPRPTYYVAMGSNNRFYIAFQNSATQWSENLPAKFHHFVQTKTVEYVALFGEYMDSYVVQTSVFAVDWNHIPVHSNASCSMLVNW